MSLNPDGSENKIKLISDTMTGFYSVMRNLQEDYATYHQNYSEEALALLSRSDDFIESVEAVRSLDSLSRIDDEGINELFLLSQQIAELYHLNVQERDKENPVTEVKSEKGFWQTVWGVMKGGRDSPIVRNSLEQVTGAIADIGDKIGNGLKSGVDWVIENEPDLPVYQRLCNPLFGFFMVGGAVQSWIQNRNLDNTSKNAVENLKAFQKGLADSFIEMGTGLLSLPKAVVDLYYKECEVGDDIAAYLDNCSPEQIPEDFRNWFNKSKEQVKEIGLELKKEVIRQLSEKDVKEYYETFGYLTGTIASFFIGAGEAKAASEAGKVGNATRIENAAITAGKVTKAEQTSKLRQASEKIENAGKKLKNKASKISQKAKKSPKSQVVPNEGVQNIVGRKITEVDENLLKAKGYETYKKTDGTLGIKRQKGFADKIDKLSVDKDGNIIKIEKSSMKNVPKSNGIWSGTRGNSKWIPDKHYIPKQFNESELTWESLLQKYDIDGINYKNGYPDFSGISKGDVSIKNFSAKRNGLGGNFDQADELLAEIRTKNGKHCTGSDVTKWRRDNNYTWHEEPDCMTMRKVPLEIHQNMWHKGGISKKKEINKQLKEVVFDD